MVSIERLIQMYQETNDVKNKGIVFKEIKNKNKSIKNLILLYQWENDNFFKNNIFKEIENNVLQIIKQNENEKDAQRNSITEK